MNDVVMLGTAVKRIREEKGLRANYVAKRMNIHPSTLSKYESNKRKIDGHILPSLAEALECEVSDFFKVKIDETPTFKKKDTA